MVSQLSSHDLSVPNLKCFIFNKAELSEFMQDLAKNQTETEKNLFDAEALAASAGTLVPVAVVQSTLSAIDAALSKIARITDPDLVSHDSNGFTKEEREAMAEAEKLGKPLGPETKFSANEIENMIHAELAQALVPIDTPPKELCPLLPPSPVASEVTPTPVLPPPPLGKQNVPKRPRKPRATKPNATKPVATSTRNAKSGRNAKPKAEKAKDKGKGSKTKAKEAEKAKEKNKDKGKRSKTKAHATAAAVVPAVDETQLAEDGLLRKKLHSVTW